MKRGVLLILLLVSIPAVMAQEITLFNQTFSLILVLPLILIIIALIFFLFIYIKDHSKQISQFFSKNLDLKRHKKTIEKEKSNIDYFAEIENFEARYRNLNVKDALSQFSGLFGDYLKDELKLAQEYTPDELKVLLVKKKKDLVPVLDKITEIKYSPAELEYVDLEELIRYFKLTIFKTRKPKLIQKEKPILRILKQFRVFKAEAPKPEKTQSSFASKLKEEYVSSKKNFLSKLFKANAKVKKYKEAGLEKPQFGLFSKIKLDREIKGLDKAINNGMSLVKKDLEKAEHLYLNSLNVYYKLPVDTQEKFSQRLVDFHDKIDYETKKKEVNELMSLISKVEDIKKASPAGYHNFLESLKASLEFAKDKIRLSEDHFARSLNHRDLAKSLKVKLEKPLGITALRHVNFLEYLKALISEIKQKEKQGIYKLHELESNFIDHLHNFLNHLEERKKRNNFQIHVYEQDFLKKSEVLLSYIKDKDKMDKEAMEKNILDEIKVLKQPATIPIPRKPSPLLRAAKEIKQDFEKIHEKPSILSEKKPIIKKMVKTLHDSIKIPEIEYPEAKPEEITKKPFKFEHLLTRSKQYKNLNQEELNVINKLKKLETQELSISKPKQFFAKKIQISKSPWEHRIEKIRHETHKPLTKLDEERQRLSKKLHGL